MSRKVIFNQRDVTFTPPHPTHYTSIRLCITISIWIVRLPTPKIIAHVIQILFGLPTHFFLGLAGIRHINRDIPRTTWSHDSGDGLANRLAESLEHIKDRVARPGAQIEYIEFSLTTFSIAATPIHIPQSGGMSICQVHYMQIVSNSSSVRSVVVISKHHHVRPATNSHLCNEWHQIVWDTTWVLSHFARRMGTRRIEIPQNGNAPIFGIFALLTKNGMTSMKVSQYLLNHVLCPTIAVGNCHAHLICLFQLCFLIFSHAVNSRRTREHNGSTPKFIHQF
mmetsp:Transcript_16370/g.35376  ORF Transcript_16370/g.35376 Transcript_16370/m.35376 type:complete len:280 (+) Transcript_16370:293-1132(+)